MKRGPAPVARQSGGMRGVGMSGEIDSERIEQQAMQSAVQNKSQQQQSSTAPAKPSAQSKNKKSSQQQQKPAREISSLREELIDRPVKDVAEGIKSIFDLNSIVGIDPAHDTPEEMARKKKLHQRWQELTQAEQKVARDKYQQELQKKQEAEKREQQKKEQEAQQKQDTIAPPSSASKTPGLFVGGKGKKNKAQNQLQQQMKTMGVMTSAN